MAKQLPSQWLPSNIEVAWWEEGVTERKHELQNKSTESGGEVEIITLECLTFLQ